MYVCMYVFCVCMYLNIHVNVGLKISIYVYIYIDIDRCMSALHVLYRSFYKNGFYRIGPMFVCLGF